MAADPSQPVRVLYAEDDAADADLAKAYFGATAPEFALDVVTTGAECLRRLADNGAYDVLLLDNHLPDMDGLDVLVQLASRSIGVPVVLTTGVGDETVAVRALELGACDYVPKDGNYLTRLPAALTGAISEYRAQSERPYGGRGCRSRILYVEHNQADVDLTTRHLAELAPDLAVDVAESSAAALERLTRPDIHLVLADLRLPDMSALDLLREAKRRGLRVPFVVLTGRGDETAAVTALKLGAYDYIVKRDDYLTRMPYAIENAIARFQLAQMNEHLQWELAEHERLQQTTTETLALLDSLQKNAPIGIAFMDRDYRFQRINDELAAINGYPVQAHIGRTLRELLPDIWRLVEPLFKIAVTGKSVSRIELSARTPARPDEERHFLASFYPVRGVRQEVVGIGVAVSDITERKRAEAALQQHAQALADAARQKDEFLAMLGHELRNPLAPIRTALELLRRTPAVDEITARAHDVIDRQVTHMARLLDDLLDVARITTGQINLTVQTVDLRAAVDDAVDSVGNLVAARRHQLEVALPPQPVLVQGDTTRLVQVLVNLLNNAAKYTNEEGTIRLRLTREAGDAVVRVSDTGTGISARLLPRIFDLFTQDERTLDRAQGGLGLGLTLVRRITELHGGTVEARSEGRGCGSEFTVRLPLRLEQPAEARPPVAAPVGRPQSIRCLVVEDNVDAARMLELALTLEGHEVRLAFDGRDAVDAAAAFRPDAIVLDIGLPRMNGYDAARAIRQLPGLANVHIVAMTGYGQAVDRERSRESGFDAHLVKPVNLDAVLAALAALRQSQI